MLHIFTLVIFSAQVYILMQIHISYVSICFLVVFQCAVLDISEIDCSAI